MSLETFANSSLDTTLIEVSIEKFFTSAVTSKVSGKFKLFPASPRFSFIPGSANPITIFLLPSLITLPFTTSTFENDLSSSTRPVTTEKGIYMVMFCPSIFTVLASLFLYEYLIVTFPLFPASSFALTLLPSRV